MCVFIDMDSAHCQLGSSPGTLKKQFVPADIFLQLFLEFLVVGQAASGCILQASNSVNGWAYITLSIMPTKESHAQRCYHIRSVDPGVAQKTSFVQQPCSELKLQSEVWHAPGQSGASNRSGCAHRGSFSCFGKVII